MARREIATIVFSAMVFMLFAGMATAQTSTTNFEWATIGGLSNTNDNTGYGAVDYEYRISKFEMSNEYWTPAITADPDISDGDEGSGTGAGPLGRVSWYEAAKFCNYLTSGDAYIGAYVFAEAGRTGGADESVAFLSIDYTYRNDDGEVFYIPTEDEWYKAAYYSVNEDKYYDYAHGSDAVPPEGFSGDNTGWNYESAIRLGAWDVGGSALEQNGTYDMMGNTWEISTLSGGAAVLRGGHWDKDASLIRSSTRGEFAGSYEHSYTNFRIATIPEPASGIMLFAAVFGIVFLRRRLRG